MTEIVCTARSLFLNISEGDKITMIDSINGSPSQIEWVVSIASIVIASVGIVANFTVIVVSLKDKKLRKKIPNIFIINQVRFTVTHLLS